MPWTPGDEAQVAALPEDTKRKFGTVFGAIPQLQMILQKHGPVAVFETVNRLVREKQIELEIQDHGKGYRCRVKLIYLGQGEFTVH